MQLYHDFQIWWDNETYFSRAAHHPLIFSLIQLASHAKGQKLVITLFFSVQLFPDFVVSARSTREKDHIPNFPIKYPSADAFPL